MELQIKPVINEYKELYWIFYESGNLAKPLLILTDYQFDLLIKQKEELSGRIKNQTCET